MRSRRFCIAACGLLLCVTACGEDSTGSSTEESSDGGSVDNPPGTGGSTTTGGSATTGGSTTTGGSATTGTGGSDGDSGGMPTTGQGGSQGGPISAEDADEFLARLADLFCTGLAACCAEASIEFSETYCRSLFALTAGNLEGLTYDRAAGESCLADLAGRQDSCEPGGPVFCPGVFVGSVELGGACSQDADCAPSDLGATSCDLVGSNDPVEICVANIRAGEDEPCLETCFEGGGVRSCANSGEGDTNPERGQCHLSDGLWCDSSTLTCVPARERGETCSYSQECGAYAICDGVCADGAAEGQACAEFSECDEGLLCEVDQDICVPAEAASLEGVCSTFGQEG